MHTINLNNELLSKMNHHAKSVKPIKFFDSVNAISANDNLVKKPRPKYSV